jgi:hypothetical protein
LLFNCPFIRHSKTGITGTSDKEGKPAKGELLEALAVLAAVNRPNGNPFESEEERSILARRDSMRPMVSTSRVN